MTKPMNIAAMEKHTGKAWSEWVTLLDAAGGRGMPHNEIAIVVNKIVNHGWWAQGIAIAYEQHIGRRKPGQKSDGTYEISVSKTLDIAMNLLMDAWADFSASDKDIQKMIAGSPRISGTDKRMNWRAKLKDGTNIAVTAEPRSNGKSAIIIVQSKLAEESDMEKSKTFWKAKLDKVTSGK